MEERRKARSSPRWQRAAGAPHIAADAPGISWHGGQAGQAVWCAERAHVAAGRCDELGAEQGAHPGQAADHLGVRMFAEPCLDERVELGDLLVEGNYTLRETGHHGGGRLLARQRRLLANGGSDGCGGDG